MKISDDKNNFGSISDSEELWNESMSSDRSAVLVASAAFDTHLERILLKHLLYESSKGKRLLNSTLSSFSARINVCFCLGLLDENEYHDLNLLRDIRNSFAHNLFECNFQNEKVIVAIDNLICVKNFRSENFKEETKLKFLLGVMLLDKSLIMRLNQTTKVQRPDKLDLEENS
jgi:DNA-binding MltR family transcriptional regulator